MKIMSNGAETRKAGKKDLNKIEGVKCQTKRFESSAYSRVIWLLKIFEQFSSKKGELQIYSVMVYKIYWRGDKLEEAVSQQLSVQY